MRAGPLWILGCLLSMPAFAGTWANLWQTANQQGEALLAAGRPAQAAARFTSPRRKAYADLQAGRYARAARLLAPFKDATSEYNRGNALAHAGHLRAALAAYDAALKQTPHDKDIRHNRDLVARILAQHPPHHPAQKPGGHSRSGRAGRHAGHAGSGQHGAQSGGGRRGAQGQHHNPKPTHGAHQRQGQHPGNAPRTGSATPHAGGQQSSHGARPAHSGASAGGRRGHTPASTQPSAGTGAHSHSRGQTRRNAAAAAAIARRQQRNGKTGTAAGRRRPGPHPTVGPLSRLTGGKRTHPPKPPSEKTLALDQWLRQIPNNPAGLLRRKFLIQYMLRHPGANQ